MTIFVSSDLMDVPCIISAFTNLSLLVGILIRPSMRTPLNILLTSLLVINLIKISLDYYAR